jgi:aminoglycoside/choline kinase family phosphotransferase
MAGKNISTEELIREIFFNHHHFYPSNIEPLEQHASKRNLFRLGFGQDQTAIVSIEPRWSEAEAFIYLSSHFRSHGLRVPEILRTDQENGVILMEDLGRYTLFERLSQARQSGEATPDLIPESISKLYENAIQELVKFQFIAGKSIDFRRCFPAESFTLKDLKDDFELFINSLIIPLGINHDNEQLNNELSKLTLLASEDLITDTFMYRDFQSRNIVVLENNLGYIDFQSGRRGPAAYDVVSLIFQARACLPPKLRSHLKEAYCEAARQMSGFNEGSFRKSFYIWGVIRLLQTVGLAGKLGLNANHQMFKSSLPMGLALLLNLLECDELQFRPKNLIRIVKEN